MFAAELQQRTNAEADLLALREDLPEVALPVQPKLVVSPPGFHQQHVLRLHGPEAFRAQNAPTVGLVIDRFMKEERIEEILKQKPGEVAITDGISYSTAAGYRSYIRNQIRPKWATTPLAAVKPLGVAEWLKLLPLSPKTRGQVRTLMHLLFQRAMLWGLIELQRNPIELFKGEGQQQTPAETPDNDPREVSGSGHYSGRAIQDHGNRCDVHRATGFGSSGPPLGTYRFQGRSDACSTGSRQRAHRKGQNRGFE